MATYAREYSNFPDEMISMRTFKDMNESVQSIIHQIKAYRDEQNYSAAADLLREHPEIVDYVVTATDINQIIEEIYNTQVYAKEAMGGAGTATLTSTNKIIISNVAPLETFMQIGDVWIGGYNIPVPSTEGT